MTREIEEKDKYCHICQAETYWLLHCHLGGNVHVAIALCDNHRPVAAEIVHTENEGLIHVEFDRQKLTDIHFGEKKNEWVMLGPEAPGLGIRRPL